MSNPRSFILKCSMCFKVFDYQIKMTESKSSLWNFVTSSPRSHKKYAVMCTPSATKAKGLIKVALKKLPEEHRLVVVSQSNSNEEMTMAENSDYCLISFDTLNDFGQEMLEIKNLNFDSEASDDNISLLDKDQRSRDNLSLDSQDNDTEPSPSDFIDKVITKDRLF